MELFRNELMKNEERTRNFASFYLFSNEFPSNFTVPFLVSKHMFRFYLPLKYSLSLVASVSFFIGIFIL